MRIERVAAASGVGFVVVGVASFVLITASPFPSGGASAAELTAYFTDPGNGRLIQVAMTLSSVGGFLLLWFLGGLYRRLVGALGSGSLLPSVAFAGGTVFVAVLFAANAVFAAFDAPTRSTGTLGFELVLWVLVVSVLLLRRPSTSVVVSPQQAGK